MSFVGNLIGDVVGGITGAKQAGEAAEKGGQLQYQAAMAGVDEQRRQFDKLVELMSPYVQAGEAALGGLTPYSQAGLPALQQQQALAGTLGPEAQQAAIAQLEQSPQMQALVRQGENALLQQASATGGLRGGNIQAALAQFRPQVLSSLIDQQYGRLGGLTSLGQQTTQNLAQLGQASAAGQGAGGLESAAQISNLLGAGGQAQAAGTLAQGSVARQTVGDLLGLVTGGANIYSKVFKP